MATSMRHVKRRERMKRVNKMRRESKKHPSFLAEQKWKPFEVDMSAFADEEMGGFVGMEVLTDYDPNMLKKPTSGTVVGKVAKSAKKAQDVKKTQNKQQVIEKKSKGAKNKPKQSKEISDDVTKSKKNQEKSSDKKKRTIKQDIDSSEVTKAKDTLKIEEVESSPGKLRSRKRKSGKEQLRELREKRKRRKSEIEVDEQEEEELEWEEDEQEEEELEWEEDEQEEEELEWEEDEGDEQDSGTEDGKTILKDTKVEKEDAAKELPNAEVAMSMWDSLSIPTVVHDALQSMGFTKPTPIQAGCIPAAINESKDIVGAAETGSGKTLAFGIPLIYRILQHRALKAAGLDTKATKNQHIDETNGVGDELTESNESKDGLNEQGEEEGMEENEDADIKSDDANLDGEDNDDEVDDDDDDDDIDDEVDDELDDDDESDDDEEQEDMQTLKSKMKCVDVVDNIADEAWLKAGLPLTSTPAGALDQEKKLFGLVLTPTRELAVQVKNHLVAAAKMTDIKVAVVVGGMSAEKQKRVLKQRPEVIVGTPGRLWELYQLGEPHLASLPDIQCLIIDEADRMVEKGHYAELSEILNLLNSSEEKSSRQTFVFSATLSLIHLGPLRKSLKKAYKQDKKDKLDSVMSKIGIKEDAEVVDLTKREATASTLLESKIVCDVDEKYPGRTLVFTNSIDCIRRLVSILTLLQCKPLPLHSSMHQKQRLKNLERFTANPQGLLLATDVAARGLDIPDIEHVIHYQVSRTSESYVHRSGRTARQAKVGLSVTLLSPNEMNLYRRLCKTLNREEIPSFPVEHSYYQAVKDRVDLARDIDKLEHVNNKKKHQNDWFVRAAKELDVDVDEHLNLHDMGDSSEQKQFNKKLRMMRAQLKAMLKKRIFAAGSSQLYLTSHGKLLSPFSQATVGSHEAFSKLKARMKKDKAEDSKEKEKKRKKFKRMGRYHQAK